MPGDGVPGVVWDRVSHHYDHQLWLERSSARIALELLRPVAADRLLDVATGTGAILRELAGEAGRPGVAVGVDASAAMLAQVPALPEGWSVRVADARRLPFGDAAFDVLSVGYVLHVLSDADLDVVLAEAHRVLRPGGRIVTVTPAVPARGLVRPVAQALDRLAARRPDRYGGLRALDPRTALTRAGFTVDASRRSLRGYPALCVLARRPHDSSVGSTL